MPFGGAKIQKSQKYANLFSENIRKYANPAGR